MLRRLEPLFVELAPLVALDAICFPSEQHWPLGEYVGWLGQAESSPEMVCHYTEGRDAPDGVICYSVHGVGELARLFIHPRVQGLGIGRGLLAAMLERMARHPHRPRRVSCQVAADNKRAIHFYGQNNFHPVGMLPRYYEDRIDAILMDRTL